MKYRMQRDNNTGDWQLVKQNLPGGGELLITHPTILETESPIAAIEFWGEIERLQAVCKLWLEAAKENS